MMIKNDIDWAPCLELGHSKSREKGVANAEERAKCAQARRKKSMESSPLAEESSGPVDKVIQTDVIVTQCVSRGTQVESDFFDESNFCWIIRKYFITLDYQMQISYYQLLSLL